MRFHSLAEETAAQHMVRFTYKSLNLKKIKIKNQIGSSLSLQLLTSSSSLTKTSFQKRIHHFLFNTFDWRIAKERRINLKSINVNYYCSIHIGMKQMLLVFTDDSWLSWNWNCYELHEISVFMLMVFLPLFW